MSYQVKDENIQVQEIQKYSNPTQEEFNKIQHNQLSKSTGKESL